MPENNDKQRRKPERLERDAFEREIGTDLDEETPDKPKGLPLHTKILIGLALGVIAGIVTNKVFGGDHPRVVWVVDNLTQPVGQLFLRLLLMILSVVLLVAVLAARCRATQRGGLWGADTTEETTFDRFRINPKIDPKKFEVRK